MGEFYFTFCVAENFIIYEVNYFISRSDISLFCNELLDWLEYCVQNEYESQAAKPYVSRDCGFFRFSFQAVRIARKSRFGVYLGFIASKNLFFVTLFIALFI